MFGDPDEVFSIVAMAPQDVLHLLFISSVLMPDDGLCDDAPAERWRDRSFSKAERHRLILFGSDRAVEVVVLELQHLRRQARQGPLALFADRVGADP